MNILIGCNTTNCSAVELVALHILTLLTLMRTKGPPWNVRPAAEHFSATRSTAHCAGFVPSAFADKTKHTNASVSQSPPNTQRLHVHVQHTWKATEHERRRSPACHAANGATNLVADIWSCSRNLVARCRLRDSANVRVDHSHKSRQCSTTSKAIQHLQGQ